MIKIGILGDIGSGKSYIAKCFGHPVFNADYEVSKLYQNDKKFFVKLKKVFPNYFHSFPVNKEEITDAILTNENNFRNITRVVHFEIRKKMNIFLKTNINKKIVILDIPLLLENKINKKNDILVFVQSKKLDILKRLKKRKSFNLRLLEKFADIQLPSDYKKKKSQFIFINNFTKKSVKLGVKKILKEIL